MTLTPTIEQWIRLWPIVLSVVVTVIGLWKWTIKRRSLRILLKEIADDPVYIHGITSSEAGISVSSAALWVDIQICNNAHEPLLVSEIRAQYVDSESKPIIGFPIDSFDYFYPKDLHTLGRPITLPLTIEKGRGLDLWVLVEIPISEQIGMILFKQNGSKARETDTIKTFIINRERVQEHLAAKIKNELVIPKTLGVRIGELRIPQLTAKTVLLSKDCGNATIKPMGGYLPGDAGFGVFREFVEQHRTAPPKSAHAHFLIEVVTPFGKIFRNKIPTQNDPLWFLHRQNHRIPSKRAAFV